MSMLNPQRTPVWSSWDSLQQGNILGTPRKELNGTLKELHVG